MTNAHQMNPTRKSVIASLVILSSALSSCTSFPSLVEVSRVRAKDPSKADDLGVQYFITDLDVLNFTNGVKKHLDRRSSIHTNVRYGSATTMATLGGLAGAAKTLGWSTGTASTLGLGATYVFGLGQIFNSKGHAQIYEQSLASVQSAEAAFLYYRLKNSNKDLTTGGIPSSTQLTHEGEILYYRVTKILNVLYDSLAGKIPDLQDLKEAHGENAGVPSGSNTGDTGGGGTGGTNSGSSKVGDGTPPVIPEVFKPRNSRLEDAFQNMKEDEVKKKLEEDDGLSVPTGSTLKQYVAKLVLAEADLPMPKGKDALQSLTFYRQRAVDENSISKLERAYRTYHLIPPL